MPEGQVSPQEERDPTVSRVGWLLLAYFLVRVPIINLSVLGGLTENYDFVQKLDLAEYVMIAAMIVVARKSLRDFRIDRLSVILFILFGSILRIPPQVELGSAFGPIYFVFGLTALGLGVVVFRSRQNRAGLAGMDWRWLVVGLLSGVVLALVLGTFGSVISRGSIRLQPAWPITTGGLFLTFLYQMGHSAILEEPAFRGFLWGYLERHRLHPASIWQLQAVLFWLAHLRYLDRPFTLWIALPVGGLVFGWLSWKSRSISASLLAHAAYNTIGAFF